MIDVPLGNNCENYDGYMLMKFTSCYDYQQDFLNGKLFFNTSDYFAECEDDGRGDEDEGKTFIINHKEPAYISANFELIDGVYKLVVRDYSNNTDEYEPSAVLDYSEAKNRNRKIICLYTVYLNIEKQTVADFPENMAAEFGEFGVLIINRQKFFERVITAMTNIENYREGQIGFVGYYNLEKGLNDWHPFRKDLSKFGYQREFRATFVNDNPKAYMLDLGCSLRDIAVPIMASDVNKISFENGKLCYPQDWENKESPS